jgi:hypothetical protein
MLPIVKLAEILLAQPAKKVPSRLQGRYDAEMVAFVAVSAPVRN